MSLFFYSCLVFFILTGYGPGCVENFATKYVSLIWDVQTYYRTSSVFFMFSQHDRHSEDYTVVHSMFRKFSKNGIFTLIGSFDELGDRVDNYRNRIIRPLVVILIKAEIDIDEFTSNTRQMKKSYPMWLVIFDGATDDSLCARCADPMGNIFNVRFDTEMLIMCCNNLTLREWWSNDDNQTERANFGTWTEDRGLELIAEESLYARRNNVNGAGLRIAIVPNTSILVTDHGDDDALGGYFGEIFQELNRDINFTITTKIRETRYGSWNSSVKKWSGVVGQLVSGDADIGVAELTITNRRLDVVDFTLPFLTMKTRLFVRKPDGSRVKWSSYFEAFTVGIWITIIVLTITTPMLLSVIQAKESSIPLSPTILQNYLHVWGIFCQQGLCDFPTVTPMRIAYFSIFISAMVVSASYSASLTSFLTVSSVNLPFKSIDEFVNDGSYKLIVLQGSSDYDFLTGSKDPALIKMTMLMKPWAELPGDMEEGWNQLCEERVALFTNEVIKMTKNENVKCQLLEIDTGRLDSLAMPLTADSQYTGIINYYIQRFHDNGMLNRFKHKYFKTLELQKKGYDPASLSGIVPLLSVFGCGAILAFVLLFCERIHCSFCKNYYRYHRSTIDNVTV